MRAAVVHATVWRIVSDLLARQVTACGMRLEQTGCGATSRLHVVFEPGEGRAPVRWIAAFGPGGGAWWRQVAAAAPVAGGDLVEPLLRAGPAGLVERIERELGLRRPMAAPTAAASLRPDVLAVRTLAEVLARESTSRRLLASTLGALGADGDIPQPMDWALRLVEGRPGTDPADASRLRRLVSLHEAVPDAGVRAARAVLDLDLGRLHLVDADGEAVALDLAATWRADGRRLARLVERVRSHLGGRAESGGDTTMAHRLHPGGLAAAASRVVLPAEPRTGLRDVRGGRPAMAGLH